MSRIVCNIMLLMLFVSCQKIDSFMFENVVLEAYELEEYKGETQVILDSTYAIDADKMHLLSFSSAGHTIYGVYIGDTQNINTDTVIMYCHGNSGHLDWYWSRQKLLAHVGGKYRFGVLMIDYKGYGRSQGQPTQDGLVEDIQSGIDWLQLKGLTQDRLLFMVFSVTGAIASESVLSFLGLLNIDMSWGLMIYLAQVEGFIFSGMKFWWLILPAGLSVTFLTGGFYLVGRGLDEVFNPRLRDR